MYPHKKKEIALYDNWSKQTWTYRDLYKCVFQRLRQLDDFPTVVTSVTNWEQNRQALFSCAKLTDDTVLQRVKIKEILLLKSLMSHNYELLKTTCSTLGCDVSVDALVIRVTKL